MPDNRNDGHEFYEYVLLYTDDALAIGEFLEKVLCHEIGIYFTLKEASIGPPKIYLGGHVWTVQLDNGVTCWAFGSLQYVQAAVKNVETYLKDHCSRGDVMYSLPAWAEPPIQTDYCPELDILPELDSNDSAYFQSLI